MLYTLDEALRACRLPIRVWTEEEFEGDPTLCCIQEIPRQFRIKGTEFEVQEIKEEFYHLDVDTFRRKYVTLRDFLLQAEEKEKES